jgi:hypothetical protein
MQGAYAAHAALAATERHGAAGRSTHQAVFLFTRGVVATGFAGLRVLHFPFPVSGFLFPVDHSPFSERLLRIPGSSEPVDVRFAFD